MGAHPVKEHWAGSVFNTGNSSMRSSFFAVVVASAIALGAAGAHAEQFDAKKFFDKLAAEGASTMPPMVDMKK